MSENGADQVALQANASSASQAGAGNAPAAAPPPSAVGSMADLREGEVLLPAFVERRPAGLFVDPQIAEEQAFATFIDRVFVSARFVDLDYATFQALLYNQSGMKGGPVRLAAEIVLFPAERRALYHAVKISPDKSKAEYLFAPVTITVDERVPLYGPPGDDGSSEVVGEEIRKRSVPTRLDFDEFVAAMWEKGLRFNLDVARIRAAINDSQAARVEIAQRVEPTQGHDASMEEKTAALHRDNAPRILPNGRMDLRHFKNRFPQITADVRLLKKIPRELGKPGRCVTGQLIEPAIPKDFDLEAQAGPGTRVERGADGEFIVSAIDGFLLIDKQSHQISVTEKIVSREGVSMRTTGDVSLAGDEFEEHGEVQERRVVEGRNMTFFSDVFGNIISRGGRVLLKACLAGGHVDSPGGSIRVEGRASRAVLTARGGDIHVGFAEGSTIIGSQVTIDHAVNCTIQAEQVGITLAEGCAVAGKQVNVAKSGARKTIETIVSLLLPDFTQHKRAVAEIEKELQQIAALVASQEAKQAQALADSGFRQYLALAATISKGGAVLSPQQEAYWRKTQTTYAAQAHSWQELQAPVEKAQMRRAQLLDELELLAEKKLQAGAGIACSIGEVLGDTLVRRLYFQPDESVIGGAQGQAIAASLHEFGATRDRLFWGSIGSFEWHYESAVADGY